MATIDDIKDFSDQKLQFIVDNGNPAWGIHQAAQDLLQQRRNPALTGDRKAKLDADIARTSLPEPSKLGMAAQSVKEAVTQDVPQIAGAAGRQLAGTAGAAMQLPILGPTLENISDAAEAVSPKYGRAVFGSPSQAVANAPSPLAAEVAGGSLPMVGAAGRLGKAAEAGSKALLRPATETFERLAGRLPGTVLPAAATAATLGGADAAVKRLPAMATGQAYLPVDYWNEIGAPAAMGGLQALPGAVQGKAANPDTTSGETARRYALDRNAGLYKDKAYNSPYAEERATEAVGNAQQAAKSKIEEKSAIATKASQRALEDAKAPLDVTVAAEKASVEQRKGAKASELAPQIEGRMKTERKAASDAFGKTLDEIHASPEQQDEKGQPLKFSQKPVFDALEAEANKMAKEGTGKDTGDETQLPLGERLRGVIDELHRYLPEDGSTMRDVRNAVTYLDKMASSGTPTQRFPYEKALAVARDHAVEMDKTGLLKPANEAFSKETERLTRARESLGLEGEGSKVEPGAVSAERNARKFLVEHGDQGGPMATKTPEHAALEKAYPDIFSQMAAEKEQLTQQQALLEQQHQEQIRKLEDQQAAKLRDAKAGIQGEANQPVQAAEQDRESLRRSKEAQKASKVPLGKAVQAGGLITLGSLYPTSLHGAGLLMAGTGMAANALAQPMRSRSAHFLPEAGAARLSLPSMLNPSLMGATPEATAATQAGGRVLTEAERKRKAMQEYVDSLIGSTGKKQETR